MGESKTSGGESVVVVRHLERMIVHLWLCLLHAAIRLSRIPDPNPSSLSPPSLCSPIGSDPTPVVVGRCVRKREARGGLGAENHETERISSVSGAPCETVTEGDWGR